MLYLEIQKGGETMKALDFQQYVGGTTACMKRTTKAAKGCGKMYPNNIFFYNIWFSRVKISEEASS